MPRSGSTPRLLESLDGGHMLESEGAYARPRGAPSDTAPSRGLRSSEPFELYPTWLFLRDMQGGLEPNPTRPSGWRADTFVNNLFDIAAADAVYAFCFAHSIRLTVVSRHAAPLLPMQLARSFAEHTAP
ncbi:hypothetical protein T492DRAFT_871012 [Pavlovales sp. CCMP2436]|nr:hypothetical protein T492DRAFT_871012 [Pavlovales sp. CCMP2436]